jgi:hypothetical protein
MYAAVRDTLKVRLTSVYEQPIDISSPLVRASRCGLLDHVNPALIRVRWSISSNFLAPYAIRAVSSFEMFSAGPNSFPISFYLIDLI